MPIYVASMCVARGILTLDVHAYIYLQQLFSYRANNCFKIQYLLRLVVHLFFRTKRMMFFTRKMYWKCKTINVWRQFTSPLMSYELPKANDMNVYKFWVSFLCLLFSTLVLIAWALLPLTISVASMKLMLISQMIHPPFKDFNSLSKCSPSYYYC